DPHLRSATLQAADVIAVVSTDVDDQRIGGLGNLLEHVVDFQFVGSEQYLGAASVGCTRGRKGHSCKWPGEDSGAESRQKTFDRGALAGPEVPDSLPILGIASAPVRVADPPIAGL